MNLRKWTCGFALYLFSNSILADRFGRGEDYEDYGYGRGGSDFFGYIVLIAASIAAYFFLLSSYKKWRERREKNEKAQVKDGIGDWIFTIIAYLIVTVFLSLPILLIVKLVLSAAVVRENWHLVYIPFLLLLTYLRRT